MFRPTKTSPILSPLVPRSRMSRFRAWLDGLPAAALPALFLVIGGIAVVGGIVAVASPEGETAATSAERAEPAAAVVPAAAEPATTLVAADEEQMPASTASVVRSEPSRADATAPEPPAAAGEVVVLQPGEAVTAFEPDWKDMADAQTTAAIPRAMPSTEPEVAVAETEEDIAALEAEQQRDLAGEVAVAAAPMPQAGAAPLASQTAGGARAAATTTKWVNMRSGPDDDAEVLQVVPALAEIEAETECDWCAVSFEGRDGYIYKTFISYAESASAQ